MTEIFIYVWHCEFQMCTVQSVIVFFSAQRRRRKCGIADLVDNSRQYFQMLAADNGVPLSLQFTLCVQLL
jgi:hypothetical protein